MICFNFDKNGRFWVKGNHSKLELKYRKGWERKFRFLFCCVRSPKRNPRISDLSNILSSFLIELDVVPTDVAAGLILLKDFQKLEREVSVKNVSVYNVSIKFNIL